MAGKIDAFEVAVLNVLRNIAPGAVATPFLALFTTMPADDGTGGVEVSGGSYARQALSFSAPTSGAGSMVTSADVLFPVATAGWGTIVGAGIYDAASAGTCKYADTMTNVVVNSGDQLKFAAGNVTVTEG